MKLTLRDARLRTGTGGATVTVTGDTVKVRAIETVGLVTATMDLLASRPKTVKLACSVSVCAESVSAIVNVTCDSRLWAGKPRQSATWIVTSVKRLRWAWHQARS